eukprot:5125504-Prymnesium_polylepis.2
MSRAELKEDGEDLMGFGKYTELTYMQVFRRHPSYLKWALEVEKEEDLTGGLSDYVDWAKQWRRYALLSQHSDASDDDYDDDDSDEESESNESHESHSGAGFFPCRSCERPTFACTCKECIVCGVKVDVLDDEEWGDDYERCGACKITCDVCGQPVESEDDLDADDCCEACARSDEEPDLSEEEPDLSEVEVVGSRTREERDAELRAHAAEREASAEAPAGDHAPPTSQKASKRSAPIKVKPVPFLADPTAKRMKLEAIKKE